MEVAMLERVESLTAGQPPQARRGVELVNVVLLVAQLARLRLRLQLWELRLQNCPDFA